MNQMIDIDQTIKNFNIIHRGHLFERLCNMSTPELKALKEDIKAHQMKSKFIPDSHFKPDGSAHDTFIAMAKYALLKRSMWHDVVNDLFPIRKKLKWFTSLILEKNQYCGVCYKPRNRKLLKRFKKFCINHGKWILMFLIGLGTLIVMIFQYIKT
jgi:hypothetical protein